MGDRRISDLTAQTSFASGDCLAVDNSGNTESRKITAANAITTPINNVSQKVSGSTDAYSSSKAYSVGDLVIYNNTVYECTTACSAASWSVNQSNFTATTLSSKLTSLNQALNTKVTGEWDLIYGNTSQTGTTVQTLKNSHKFSEYKFILLYEIDGDRRVNPCILPTLLFKIGTEGTTHYMGLDYYSSVSNARRYILIQYVSDTQFRIQSSVSSVDIYGIK